MHSNRFLFVALVFIVITPVLCAQSKASVHDVNVVIGPLDEFSRSFGLRDEDVSSATRNAVKSTGWGVNESSAIMISVNIRSVQQREEDKYLFTIEVHGGTKDDGRDSGAIVIDDIPAVKTIEAAWNDDARILAVTRQLVKSVMTSIRNDYLRQIANRQKL